MNGYKTAIFSLLLTVFGALETFDFTQFLSAENAGTVVGVIGLVTLVLRYLTNSPIFKAKVE